MLSKADDSNRWNTVLIARGFSWTVMMGCSLASTQSQMQHEEKSQWLSSNYLSFLVPSASFSFETQPWVRDVAQSTVLRVHSQGSFVSLRRGKWLTDSWSLSLPSFVLQRASWAPSFRRLQQSETSVSSWGTDADPRPGHGFKPLEVEGSVTWVQPAPCSEAAA